MPELPDIELYLHALAPRVVGEVLERATVVGPSVLRSVDPPIEACEGRRVAGLARLGKRIVVGLDNDLFLVIHLMIAGRLRWEEVMPAAAEPGVGRRVVGAIGRGARFAGRPPGGDSRIVQASFAFARGRLLLTEAGTRKRATVHVVRGREGLREHDPGGLEPLECKTAEFAAAIRRENRTLKRALCDPHTLSGVGNAYSDEILHRARLSPVALSGRLDDEAIARLHAATRDVLAEWMERLRSAAGDRFPGPGEVTAFRPDMAVHGRFGKPCPTCGVAVQRIVHAENETNYCPGCQTDGRVLADRSLSRLLKQDWPKTIEEWERLRAPRGGA